MGFREGTPSCSDGGLGVSAAIVIVRAAAVSDRREEPNVQWANGIGLGGWQSWVELSRDWQLATGTTP
jgi:hypothetical protein